MPSRPPDLPLEQGRGPWAAPYVDQPLEFWQGLARDFAGYIQEVYLPLPGLSLGSGRPPQPASHLEEFLVQAPLPHGVLVNPAVLPLPIEEAAPLVIQAMKEHTSRHACAGVTVSNLLLARRLREALPDLRITASCLMEVHLPSQALLLNGVCDALVPSNRIMRHLPALAELKDAFTGQMRLLVNEACLPGCLLRAQHFAEMNSGLANPRSLCAELLDEQPWLRLTGAWVLPQHLHLFTGLYDQLKLAGRVTLKDPARYRQVLGAYVWGRPLMPHEIGGGPASPLEPLEITEEFYAYTLRCGHACHTCDRCREYAQGMGLTS